MDYNIGPRDTLQRPLQRQPVHGREPGKREATSALQHTGNNQVNTHNLAVVYTKVIGTKMVWDARFNFVRDNEPGLANSNAPEVSIINGIIFGRNNFSPRYTNTRAYQPINSLSYATGRHIFKFGADINIAKADNFFPGFFSGSYVFPSYAAFLAAQPSTYQQGFSSSGTVAPISHPDVNEWPFSGRTHGEPAIV